ncbi:MAG: hypothetical protein M3179_01350 [Actinomycetota bacterium]|nr:hypothetical protein [Actinomycetota bacterium]
MIDGLLYELPWGTHVFTVAPGRRPGALLRRVAVDADVSDHGVTSTDPA